MVPRNGWTLIELLVVLVVGSVCLALLVCGILGARSSSRLNQCSSNLRQLGIGLQSYHQAFGMLPPAAVRGDLTSSFNLTCQTSQGQPYSIPRTYANWTVLLLDHVERPDLAALFDTSLAITEPVNQAGRETVLPLMGCPSDTYNRENNRHTLSPVGQSPSQFARGNYAINGGTNDLKYVPGKPWAPAPNGMHRDYVGNMERPTERIWGNGVAGFNKSFSVDEFQNGLSNTVAIEEVRAGMVSEDARGVWALGLVGASVTFSHGLAGDDRGPNCPHPRSDDVVGCNQAHEAFSSEGLVQHGMPCCAYATSAQATSRSCHRGGVNLMMMDGSTRFVADDIDLSLWHSMHSRETRETTLPSEEGPVGNVRIDDSIEEQRVELSGRATNQSDSKSPGNFTNSIGMLLVRVPAGEYTMGLPDTDCDIDDPITGLPPEVPPHDVRITREFCIGAHEVTQQQYQDVVGKNPSWHSPDGGGRIEVIGKDHGRFPVEQVSWNDAVEFCRRLSAIPEEAKARRHYRLPTEAEWEYCCRAGSREPFRVPDPQKAIKTGYNVWPDLAQGLSIVHVGSYPENDFGLFDMRGNVWEWCSDWFAWDYYSRSPEEDPQGPDSGALKVVRGADWRFTGMGCHYPRFHTEPWRTNPFIGFRVVCELKAE